MREGESPCAGQTRPRSQRAPQAPAQSTLCG